MKDLITELQDMRYLSWAKSRKSSGTAGSFLKSYDDSVSPKKYYKLSDYDPVRGIVGHECVNEIIVQRLLSILGIDHLEYKLIHALVQIDGKEHETWLCESEDYKKKDETKLPLEDYYLINRQEDESPFDLCVRMGWSSYIYGMLVTDYLVLNRDRHGANIEILKSEKERTVRLAPLFDHGLSLVCRCHSENELAAFEVMEDRKVQAFIGTGSTKDNLKLVPREYLRSLPAFDEDRLSSLFKGLDPVLQPPYKEKIQEMIQRRWLSLGSI